MCIGEEERETETEKQREKEREREREKLKCKNCNNQILPFSAYTLPVHLQLVLEVADESFHDLACLDNQLSSNCQ